MAIEKVNALRLHTCEKCREDKVAMAFPKTKSPFFPRGRLNICSDCIEEMLRFYKRDLDFANQLCQWANIPFDPNEWIELYESNFERTFAVYNELHLSEDRKDVNWLQYNQKWVDAAAANELGESIDVISAEQKRQLQKKWGENYSPEEIDYLEQLFNGILQTQNVAGKLQFDQALKLCKVSLLIDQKIRAGENFKDLLSNYDKLVQVADFTPKNTKNANDFDSAGEIFAYLEKTGWMNKYYDGATRDVVDKTIKNIQAWTRHLYVNETGIADDIQKKIEGLKMAKQLEEQEDNYDENIDQTIEDYGDEGFNVDEEFEVDI